jgi:molybdate transport system regulatory protein
MSESSKPRPAFKAWLETDEGYVFGPGVYRLLNKIREKGTLKEAAGSLGMSYRFAWGLVKKAEEKLGQPLLHAHKGGRAGGGGAELTAVGLQFLEEYSKIESVISQLTRDPRILERFMSRNQVEARVTEIGKSGDRADLTIQLRERTILKLSVSEKLLEGLDIAIGDTVKVDMTTTVGSLKR